MWKRFWFKNDYKITPPPPQSLSLRNFFLKSPLEEHHAFWYHTDEKNQKIKTSKTFFFEFLGVFYWKIAGRISAPSPSWKTEFFFHVGAVIIPFRVGQFVFVFSQKVVYSGTNKFFSPQLDYYHLMIFVLTYCKT